MQALEVLPIAAAPEPRQLTEEEAKHLEEQEEDTLRELRIFLRNVTHRLAIDKRFRVFTKPVDLHEVKGYIYIYIFILCLSNYIRLKHLTHFPWNIKVQWRNCLVLPTFDLMWIWQVGKVMKWTSHSFWIPSRAKVLVSMNEMIMKGR